MTPILFIFIQISYNSPKMATCAEEESEVYSQEWLRRLPVFLVLWAALQLAVLKVDRDALDHKSPSFALGPDLFHGAGEDVAC